MITKYLDAQDKISFNQKLRRKRFAFFLDLYNSFPPDKPVRILDIGGEENYWENMQFFQNATNAQILLLNLQAVTTRHPKVQSVAGDATDLSRYRDHEFDIVFSNSVIEHLYTRENQQKMASEMRRVGKNYYVQTPNYYFPIEPHFIFPFFQFFPLSLKIALARNLHLGNYRKMSKEDAVRICKEINLLTEKEMKNLFPDGQVYREFFAGLKKSIALYNFNNARPNA